MPYFKIGAPESKILWTLDLPLEERVYPPHDDDQNYNFLPGDVMAVMSQGGGINAFQVVPIIVKGGAFEYYPDITTDTPCYGLFGVIYDQATAATQDDFRGPNNLIAVPCPPLNHPDSTNFDEP